MSDDRVEALVRRLHTNCAANYRDCPNCRDIRTAILSGIELAAKVADEADSEWCEHGLASRRDIVRAIRALLKEKP